MSFQRFDAQTAFTPRITYSVNPLRCAGDQCAALPADALQLAVHLADPSTQTYNVTMNSGQEGPFTNARFLGTMTSTADKHAQGLVLLNCQQTGDTKDERSCRDGDHIMCKIHRNSVECQPMSRSSPSNAVYRVWLDGQPSTRDDVAVTESCFQANCSDKRGVKCCSGYRCQPFEDAGTCRPV